MTPSIKKKFRNRYFKVSPYWKKKITIHSCYLGILGSNFNLFQVLVLCLLVSDSHFVAALMKCFINEDGITNTHTLAHPLQASQFYFSLCWYSHTFVFHISDAWGLDSIIIELFNQTHSLLWQYLALVTAITHNKHSTSNSLMGDFFSGFYIIKNHVALNRHLDTDCNSELFCYGFLYT